MHLTSQPATAENLTYKNMLKKSKKVFFSKNQLIVNRFKIVDSSQKIQMNRQTIHI